MQLPLHKRRDGRSFSSALHDGYYGN